MSDNCLFCKIASGAIPSKVVYEDEEIFAFHDITPVAPLHILVIPKKHIKSANEMEEEDTMVVGKIFHRIRLIAKEFGMSEKGFRVVNNTGEFGGQTVHHIHFHLLGGRHMQWPPG
jgi:histidine triad (HIT) family protein